MITWIFILFAVVIGFIGLYLFINRKGLLGIPAERLGSTAAVYGVLLLIVAVLTLGSAIIYRTAPMPTTLFVIIGTLLTTATVVTIGSRIF